jgi:hypothetical protein
VLARRAPPGIRCLHLDLHVAGASSRHDLAEIFVVKIERFRGSPVDFRVILWRLLCAADERIVGRERATNGNSNGYGRRRACSANMEALTVLHACCSKCIDKLV